MMLTMAAVFWIAGLTADRPAIAAELQHFDLSPGNELIVVGWYQSRMGNGLTLDDCSHEFQIDPEANFPALRAFDLRAASLAVRCRVQRGEKPGSITLRVLGLIEGPTVEELLESIRSTFDATPHARRLAVISWIFSLPEEEVPSASAIAVELFEKTLQEIDSVAAADQNVDRILELFSANQSILSKTPLWESEITQLANQFVTTEKTAQTVQALGFTRFDDRWISENQLLGKLGMVRRGDAIITMERNVLEQVADEWEMSGRRKELLRGLTNTQYETYVRKRELHEGMERPEALAAWGYPSDVTWLTRESHRYELWWFRGRQVYLINDLVFGWSEE